MAISAPVLRPAGRTYGSTLQERMVSLLSHEQTRMVSVLVLLRAGKPLSLISMGRKYTSCVRRLKPFRSTWILAVLSVRKKERKEGRHVGEQIVLV